jgi:hypothetical protein
MQDLRRQLQEIMGYFACPKGFECCNPEFDPPCKAQDVGLETFVECLEDDSYKCVFSICLGGEYLCKCPLRVYIAKKLKK